MLNHIMTGFGTPDGQYSWISDNVKEILGLTAEEIAEHRPTIVPVSLDARYAQILAEEKQRRGPCLTFRSWRIEVRNNGDMIPLAVVALFLRDDDGELEKVAGAAWRTGHCPICSRLFPEKLHQAMFGLAEATATTL